MIFKARSASEEKLIIPLAHASGSAPDDWREDMAVTSGNLKTEHLPIPQLQPVAAGADETQAFIPIRLVLAPNGLALELDRPNLILGRSKECDLWLPLPDVSRQHARLFFWKGEWVIQDLASKNGIFVNGGKVARMTLRVGDHIEVGGFKFQVEAVEYRKP